MINQLIEKFGQCETRSEKVQVLTVLPKSMSRATIQGLFGAPDYMVRQAKKLVEEKGVLSLPNPQTRPFSRDTSSEVHQFYKSDEVSRVMPGMSDFVTVRYENGEKERKQKHLVLCNLKEAYQKFKEKFPEAKLGFSKFAQLRPKECVLAGPHGTHSVCVCTIHQNAKLMLLGSKLQKLTAPSSSWSFTILPLS